MGTPNLFNAIISSAMLDYAALLNPLPPWSFGIKFQWLSGPKWIWKISFNWTNWIPLPFGSHFQYGCPCFYWLFLMTNITGSKTHRYMILVSFPMFSGTGCLVVMRKIIFYPFPFEKIKIAIMIFACFYCLVQLFTQDLLFNCCSWITALNYSLLVKKQDWCVWQQVLLICLHLTPFV